MEPMEVIDLSSDDEKSPLKVEEKTVKMEKTASPRPAMKITVDKIEKKNDKDYVHATSGQKRSMTSGEDNCQIKKLKLSIDGKISRIKLVESKSLSKDLSERNMTSENGSSSNRSDKSSRKTSSPRSSPEILVSETEIIAAGERSSAEFETRRNDTNSCDKETSRPARQSSRSRDDGDGDGESSLAVKTTGRPQLVVKSKVRVSESEERVFAPIKEMFQSFLDVCSNKDPGTIMKKILRRLQKHFDNLEPGFAKSESFMHLIRNKRDLITNNASDTYRHMQEVKDEMKARKIRYNPVIRYDNEGGDPTENEEAVTNESSKEYQRLRLLEKAMRRCQRCINKCETAEVDFDDENDSHYILAERYKHRMVELYNKYCEITGERPDAARPYLRPKNFPVTPLPLLNNAIASFINTKITKLNKWGNKKQEKRSISFAEALIFPDYVDILNCVQKCNTEQNLQLSKRKEKEIAKQAFTDLGEHLQRCRQRDYYDTFSLYLEQGNEDPASGDEELARKLRENQEIGKKKLNEVFEEFVVQQNTIAENVAASNAGKEREDDRSDLSSHNTASDSDESDNELPSARWEDDSNENENNNSSSKPLRIDSDQEEEGEDARVDTSAKKNNSNETNGESNIKASDVDKVENSLEKTGKRKRDSDTSKPSNEEAKENIEILVGKVTPNETSLQTNKVSRTPVKKVETERKLEVKRIAVSPIVNEKSASPPIPNPNPIPIQEPASVPVATEEIAIPPSEKLDGNLARDDSPTEDIEVIVTPAIAATVKTTDDEIEKKPILRLRSFAKLSANWKDSQVPTSEPIENTEKSGTVGRDAASPKAVKTYSNKLGRVKPMNPNPLTSWKNVIEVKSGLVRDSNSSKKTTLTIPSNVVSGKNSTVNVQNVTNNITVVNVRNGSEFTPKIESVVSCSTKAPKIIVENREVRTMVSHRDERVANVTLKKGQTSGRAVAPRVSTGNNIHEVPVNKLADQCLVKNEKAAVYASPQRTYKILSPKNMLSKIQTNNIRALPMKDKNGKVILYQVVKSAPAGSTATQKVTVPRTVAQSQTSREHNNQPPNRSSLPVANNKSKPLITQSSNNKPHIRVYKPYFKSANKPPDAPTRSVPTYVIE